MEKQSSLVKQLAQLNPLIGRWTFKGSFKDNPDKGEGWETYEVINDGSAILCDSETRTILSGSIIDIYKHSMKIVFNKDKKKIMGDNDWILSVVKGTFLLQNNMYRFTGKIVESKGTITGKWENKSTSGKWKYWYDKVLTKTA